jgi:hypothetical protein
MSDTEPQSRIGSSERVGPVPDSPVDAVLSLQAPIGDYEGPGRLEEPGCRSQGEPPSNAKTNRRLRSSSVYQLTRFNL